MRDLQKTCIHAVTSYVIAVPVYKLLATSTLWSHQPQQLIIFNNFKEMTKSEPSPTDSPTLASAWPWPAHLYMTMQSGNWLDCMHIGLPTYTKVKYKPRVVVGGFLIILPCVGMDKNNYNKQFKSCMGVLCSYSYIIQMVTRSYAWACMHLFQPSLALFYAKQRQALSSRTWIHRDNVCALP